MHDATLDMHPAARDALRFIAAQIRIERTARSMTQARLAHLVRCSPNTIRAIEDGNPGCAVGTVFACCSALGIPLLYEEADRLRTRRGDVEVTAALLPRRVRPGTEEVDVDF